MKTLLLKFTWFVFCLFLFSYNAWRCVDQFLLLETVTKSSQERQELQNFPMICLGPESLLKETTGKLNMTPNAYRMGVSWRKENMSEEEVYNNISVGFEDLVHKIRVSKTKMKDSGAYEKIYIESKDIELSGIQLIQSDYYWELKRFCMLFPHDSFPYGIQAIALYMKQKRNVQIFITSPGNAYSFDRKANRFPYGGGMITYSIEYILYHSLNLDTEPCSEETSWKEDNCALGLINDMIMNTFNCTTPWLLNWARYFINRELFYKLRNY